MKPLGSSLETIAAHFDISVTDLLFGVEFAGALTDQALPPGLPDLLNDSEWASEIDDAWKELLLKINLRGARPQTKKQWLELYLSLKRVLENK